MYYAHVYLDRSRVDMIITTFMPRTALIVIGHILCLYIEEARKKMQIPKSIDTASTVKIDKAADTKQKSLRGSGRKNV